jgi:GntR family transcriptional regulator
MTSGFTFRLDLKTGVPVYRQLIDQVLLAVASGQLKAGDRLPTVRQLAVDLGVNPNTVVRAYKELEIREILTTHQGSGTFVSDKKVEPATLERQRRLTVLVSSMVAQASADGFSKDEIETTLNSLFSEE